MSYYQLCRTFGVISTVLVLASAVALFYPGPKLSLEFTGGTQMEIQTSPKTTKADIEKALTTFPEKIDALAHATVSKTMQNSFFIRAGDITNEQHLALQQYLEKQLGTMKEIQFTTIGPTVGATLKRQALIALAVASIAIILYLAFAFRKVPRKLSPINFGFAAVIALLHDLMITTGIFTILSHYTTFQMDTLFITALLTILGYSVNDTIIIFDRIRHNLALEKNNQNFGELAARSLKQTLNRTFNTTFCTLITLVSLLFLGPESVRWFILTLIFGIIIGTYSSFFVATPLLVYWRKNK